MDDAVSEINPQSGRQFDPEIVAAFLRVLPAAAAEPLVLSTTLAVAAA